MPKDFVLKKKKKIWESWLPIKGIHMHIFRMYFSMNNIHQWHMIFDSGSKISTNGHKAKDEKKKPILEQTSKYCYKTYC